jgi:hypothetical protein
MATAAALSPARSRARSAVSPKPSPRLDNDPRRMNGGNHDRWVPNKDPVNMAPGPVAASVAGSYAVLLTGQTASCARTQAAWPTGPNFKACLQHRVIWNYSAIAESQLSNVPTAVLKLYNGQTVTGVLAPGHVFQQFFPLKATFGWYDLVISVESDPTFRQQPAGHLETGLTRRTDPGSAGNGE